MNIFNAKVIKKMKFINNEANKKNQQEHIHIKEYLCLLIKTIEDCFKKLSTHSHEETKDLIIQ